MEIGLKSKQQIFTEKGAGGAVNRNKSDMTLSFMPFTILLGGQDI